MMSGDLLGINKIHSQICHLLTFPEICPDRLILISDFQVSENNVEHTFRPDNLWLPFATISVTNLKFLDNQE